MSLKSVGMGGGCVAGRRHSLMMQLLRAALALSSVALCREISVRPRAAKSAQMARLRGATNLHG